MCLFLCGKREAFLKKGIVIAVFLLYNKKGRLQSGFFLIKKKPS